MCIDTKIIKCDVATNSVVQHGTIRCDSDHAVYRADAVCNEDLDAKPVVTSGDAVLKLEVDVDSDINVYNMKQASSEDDESLSEAPKQKKPIRKTKNRSTGVTKTRRVGVKSKCAAGEEKARVGCPFYRKDPKAHAQTTSCRGIGFLEMAKLKDHLKKPHGLTTADFKDKLNFKAKRYTSLETLGGKWELVFQDLFPEIPKDEIPSPYVSEDFSKPYRPEVAPRGAEISNFKVFLESRLRNDLTASDFAVWFDSNYDLAFEDWKYGVISDNMKKAANILFEKEEAIQTAQDILSTVGLHGYRLCPASDQSSPLVSKTNFNSFNGLSSKPQVMRADSAQSLHQNTGALAQQNEPEADLISKGIETNLMSIVLASGPELADTNATDHTSNEFGTWQYVFVPHETSPKVDDPCAVDLDVCPAGEAVLSSDTSLKTWNIVDEPMDDASITLDQSGEHFEFQTQYPWHVMHPAPATAWSPMFIQEPSTALGPEFERSATPPIRKSSVSSFNMEEWIERDEWIKVDEPQTEVVEKGYNDFWFDTDTDMEDFDPCKSCWEF